MLHLDVMNKKTNFLKSMVTTPKVPTVSMEHCKTWFCGLYEKHWSHFPQFLESDFVDDGPLFKMKNNTWKNLNMHL